MLSKFPCNISHDLFIPSGSERHPPCPLMSPSCLHQYVDLTSHYKLQDFEDNDHAILEQTFQYQQ